MRLTLGSLAILEGKLYFADAHAGDEWLAVLALVVGGSLVVGILTQASAAVMGIGTVCIALYWLHPPQVNALEARLVTLLLVVLATSVVLLGPGDLSVDARLFGRREIIIPHSSGTRPDSNHYKG